jgi:hypothetical protein
MVYMKFEVLQTEIWSLKISLNAPNYWHSKFSRTGMLCGLFQTSSSLGYLYRAFNASILREARHCLFACGNYLGDFAEAKSKTS